MWFFCASNDTLCLGGVFWLIQLAVSFQAVRAARLGGRDVPAEHVPAMPQSFGVHLVRDIEHVGSPFTQGLEFTADGELLVETSGSYPFGTLSFVRTLDPKTGEVKFRTTVGLDDSAAPSGRFIEGITQLEVSSESHWFASTYTDRVVIEYDQELNKVGEHDFPFMGWGLTRNGDGSAFVATNGSAHVMELQLRAAGGFEVGSVKTATCFGRDVREINELEMVDDFMGRGPALLGNLYRSRVVLVLDPDTMRCTGAFHLEGLGAEASGERFGTHVANGIAYNKHTGNFIVTGKNWKQMFEISVEEEPAHGSRALELLAHRLNIGESHGGSSSSTSLLDSSIQTPFPALW